MMKGSLSWQLHLVRANLARVSTRCSGWMNLGCGGSQLIFEACWRTLLLFALHWECVLSVEFTVRSGGYSPCGFHLRASCMWQCGSQVHTCILCCSHCRDWSASSLMSFVYRLLPKLHGPGSMQQYPSVIPAMLAMSVLSVKLLMHVSFFSVRRVLS